MVPFWVSEFAFLFWKGKPQKHCCFKKPSKKFWSSMTLDTRSNSLVYFFMLVSFLTISVSLGTMLPLLHFQNLPKIPLLLPITLIVMSKCEIPAGFDQIGVEWYTLPYTYLTSPYNLQIFREGYYLFNPLSPNEMKPEFVWQHLLIFNTLLLPLLPPQLLCVKV